MMDIHYRKNGDLGITKCEFFNDVMVGTGKCRACEHHASQNTIDEFVECTFVVVTEEAKPTKKTWKVVGENFLHKHPNMEKSLNIDDKHSIVDTDELKEVQQFFNDNPHLIEWLGKGEIQYDSNTQKPKKLSDTLIEVQNNIDGVNDVCDCDCVEIH